jgi:hypothetical protein
MGLGARFWVSIIGGTIACVVAAIVLFLVIGEAWLRWGFLGMFLVFAALMLGIGWVVDRRARNRDYGLGDAES